MANTDVLVPRSHDGRTRAVLKRTLSHLMPKRQRGTISETATENTVEKGTPTRFLAALKPCLSQESKVDELEPTWDDWLESYQRGGKNLSDAKRPTCFSGFGHMVPPEACDESARLRAVTMVECDKWWWQHRNRRDKWLASQLQPIIDRFGLSSATVSILDHYTQKVCFQIGLDSELRIVARHLSIDAHTLLSTPYFCLLDASSDWRTRLNPLVHGPPFIKFYFGVPIMVQGLAIGVLATTDPYLRPRSPPGLFEALNTISEQISVQLENSNRLEPPSRIDWGSSSPSSSGSPSTTGDESTSTTTAAASDFDISEYCLEHTVATSTLHPLSGTQQRVLQPFQVFESLLRCRSLPRAVVKACRIVCQTLGAEGVYVVEARRLSLSKPPARLVGKYEVAVSEDYGIELLNSDLISATLRSEHGLRLVAGGDAKSLAHSGLLIPFRRSSPPNSAIPDLDRTEKKGSSAKFHGDGGFVMAAFASQERSFSPGDVAFTKKVVRALENILQCREETVLSL